MRTLRAKRVSPPDVPDRPSPSGDSPRPGADTPVDATLLPAGRARQAMRADVGTTGARRTTRQPRWGLWLGCALALIAVVITLAAVGGLRGAPAPAATPAASTAGPSTPPGSQVVVARSGPSQLHVTERLVLLRPVAAVPLTRPDLSADRSLTLPQPVISGLTVTSADGAVQVRPTTTGWIAQAPAKQTFSRLTIDYDLSGAIIRQPQAVVPGRALLVVAPVSASTARDLGIPVSVTAPGIPVRQAICVTSPGTQQLCGQLGDSGWVARLTSWQTVAVVVLQADLAS